MQLLDERGSQEPGNLGRRDPVSADRIAALLQSLEGGGAHRRVVTLVNRFASLGREVDLIVVEQRGLLAEAVSAQVCVIGLDAGCGKPARWRTRGGAIAASRSCSRDTSASGCRMRCSPALQPCVRLRRAPHRAVPPVPLLLRASSHPLRPISWSRPHKRFIEMTRRLGRARD
jgi:hypothetical protein